MSQYINYTWNKNTLKALQYLLVIFQQGID
jgi:hypothetical protein